MRTSSPLLVLGLVGLAAGCSRPKPAATHDLDLVLNDNVRPAVASPLEIWGKDRPSAVAPAREGAVARVHAQRRARTRRLAAVPRRAPGPERAPLAAARAPEPAVAVAPAPPPQAEPAPAPVPTAAPEPAPAPPDEPQGGRGRGGWSAPGGGIHIPGFPGGVIIIRGGHSGMDPCDEDHRGGRGGGIFPGPGRGGRGFPGGIVFLRGR